MDKLIITVTCDSTMSCLNPNNRRLEASTRWPRSMCAASMRAPRSAICMVPTRSTRKSSPMVQLSDLDIPGWRKLHDGITSKVDTVIQCGIANGRFPQRKQLMEDQWPDMISTCFNAHDECFDWPGNEPVELYGLHNRDELAEYCRVTDQLGVKIEVEAFHMGGVWNAMRMVEKGLLKTRMDDVLLWMEGGCWTPPTPKAVHFMADHCPEDFSWNTSVMNRGFLDRDRGGDRRRRACARRHGGQSVRNQDEYGSNAELVEKAVRIARDIGRDIATRTRPGKSAPSPEPQALIECAHESGGSQEPAPGSSIETIDDPRPGQDDAVIRVEACGIDGTDLKLLEGFGYTPELPFVMGHEPAGVIESVGERVTAFKPGDRVVPYISDPTRQRLVRK